MFGSTLLLLLQSRGGALSTRVIPGIAAPKVVRKFGVVDASRTDVEPKKVTP